MLPENPQISEGAPPVALISRRDCALWSALLFCACFVAGLAMEVLVIYALSAHPGAEFAQAVSPLLAVFYVGLAPAAAIGAIVGFELHRLAVGSRPPREMKWYSWLVVFFATGTGVIAIYMQTYRRKNLILDRRPLTAIAPFVYAGIGLIVFATTFLNGSARKGMDLFIYLNSMNVATMTLFAADCFAVNAVARCMRQGRLAQPPSHTIQFSLATLFYGVLILGVYATGLVTLFR